MNYLLFDKTPTSKYKTLWACSTICIALFDFLIFFRATGTGDIQQHFIYWVDNVYQYGFRQGFIMNNDMYPPLSTILMYLMSRICYFFDYAQAIRAADIAALLICGLWIIYKYDKPEYGFWFVVSCLLNVHLGFIDTLVFPFLILSFWFLHKERYFLFAIFFTLCCCVKMQPLILAPIILCYFINIRSEKPYLFINFKRIIQMAGIVCITLLPFFLIYGIKPIIKCINEGLIAPGFSDNALNFIWVIQYLCEMFFPDKTQPLMDGLPSIYWAPHGKMFYFNYIFWIIFILLCIFTMSLKYKKPTALLKICIIEYTAYFSFKLAVHENHLILAMVLTCILLCLENNYINRWIFMFYAFATNINMFLFYGMTGASPFHTFSVGNIPNSVIIALFNFICLSAICILLLISILNEQKAGMKDCVSA